MFLDKNNQFTNTTNISAPAKTSSLLTPMNEDKLTIKIRKIMLEGSAKKERRESKPSGRKRKEKANLKKSDTIKIKLDLSGADPE